MNEPYDSTQDLETTIKVLKQFRADQCAGPTETRTINLEQFIDELTSYFGMIKQNMDSEINDWPCIQDAYDHAMGIIK